jgi:uncharacterized protein (TIGR00288 family)
MPREDDHPQVALFIDAENILIGALSGAFPHPMAAIVDLVRKHGFLMSAQAYGDWTRRPCQQFLREFQMNTVEMKQLPTSAAGKNTADINLAVDAIEMALSPASPDTIVLAAADRDFVPLVQKLRRYGKEVIGIGVRGRVSRELEQVCSTFVMLDDLIPEAAQESGPTAEPARGGAGTEDAPEAEARPTTPTTPESGEGLQVSPYVEEPDEAAPELTYDTPAEASESYRTILLSGKKVSIIRWADRRRLVEHLWEALKQKPAGLTLSEMNSELIKFARREAPGLPDRAVQKLVHTLNVAQCFTDGGQARRFRDPSQSQTHLHTAVSLADALIAMHEGYVRAIQAAEPQAPLNDRGLALLLFDDEADKRLREVRALLKRITGRPAARKRTAKRSPRQARRTTRSAKAGSDD